MDVTCDRCSTRYEFDEALVSSRGTTVKCTACGHQFKIYRRSETPGLDGWTVRTVDGRVLRFEAMRELQAAIGSGRVTTEDVLIPHDGGEPRRLARIEELQSFFGSSSDEITDVRGASWVPPAPSAPPRKKIERPTVPKMQRMGAGPESQPSATDRDGNRLPARTGDTMRPGPATDVDPFPVPGAPHLPRLAQPPPSSFSAEDAAPTRKQRRVQTLPPPGPAGHSSAPPKLTAPRRLGTSPQSSLIRTKGGAPTPAQRTAAQAAAARANAGPKKTAVQGSTLPSAMNTRDAAIEKYKAAGGQISKSGFPQPQISHPSLIDSNFDEATNPRGKVTGDDAPTRAMRRDKVLEAADDATVASDDALTKHASLKRSGSGKRPRPAVARSTPPRPDLPSEHPVEDPISSEGRYTPTPSAQRPSLLQRPDSHGPRLSDYPTSQRRSGWVRWVVGLVAIGLLGVGGFALIRELGDKPTAAPAASSAPDERVNKFVKLGEERLAEGDLEGAKEQYNKASGIAEDDPRVSSGLAKVELVRADLSWLHLRLLEQDAAQRSSVGLQLRRQIDRATAAVDEAAKRAPQEAATAAMQMDLLRLQGKAEEARKLATKLTDGGAESGRVLAALDLIESSPNFASIFERLRTAARAERKLGRAHAVLIYALGLAGKKAEAEQELSALKARNPQHLLLEPLKRYVDRAEESNEDPSAPSASVAAQDPNAPAPLPRDFREALRRGHAARSRGDLDQAERLYNQALDADPGNTEAMAGLADVARDRGDTGSATSRYKDMLANNPNYLPGKIGLADLKWANGDRAGAVALYQEVVQTAPGSAYAAHARSRINAAASQPPTPQPPSSNSAEPSGPEPAPQPPTPTPTPSPEPPPPPAPEPAPNNDPPPIDTSDLPE